MCPVKIEPILDITPRGGGRLEGLTAVRLVSVSGRNSILATDCCQNSHKRSSFVNERVIFRLKLDNGLCWSQDSENNGFSEKHFTISRQISDNSRNDLQKNLLSMTGPLI